MQIAVLGIDLGKNSCSLVALDQAGAVVKRRRMRPESIPTFTKTIAACVVAMEAAVEPIISAGCWQLRVMVPSAFAPASMSGTKQRPRRSGYAACRMLITVVAAQRN